MHHSVEHNHNSLKKINLDPIQRGHYKTVMKTKVKEQNFILDCTNTQQSKLTSYNYLKDKYLTYFVVRIPKKVKMECMKQEKKTQLDSKELKRFIQRKKNKILRQKRNLSHDFLEEKENLQNPNRKMKSKTKKNKKASKQQNNQNSPIKNFNNEFDQPNFDSTQQNISHQKSPISLLRNNH